MLNIGVINETITIFSIFVFFPHGKDKPKGYNTCHKLCCRNRDPYAVRTPYEREDHNSACLKRQRAQKRDQGRNKPVVQCGEKGRAEYGEACKQKGK